MIRVGSSWGRIARVAAFATIAAALAAPGTAAAQSAVEEYQLDIPGGGSDPANPSSPPPTGATASGDAGAGGGASGTTDTGGGQSTSSGGGGSGGGGGGRGEGGAGSGKSGEGAGSTDLGQLHDGKTAGLDTSSRSAPEVVADTLLDSAMLPILAVLALITGVGVWRVLRTRRSLSGHAS